MPVWLCNLINRPTADQDGLGALYVVKDFVDVISGCGDLIEGPPLCQTAKSPLGCDERRLFGITGIVRTVQTKPLLLFQRAAGSLPACFLSLSMIGCGLFATRDGLETGYYLPLTVLVRTAPSVAAAQVTYEDACGQAKTLPLGGPLSAAITQKAGRVFEKVVTDGKDQAPVDGYEDVSVGLIQLDMGISRKVKRTYPVTLAIGLDFAYTAADGTVLYSKKLKSIGQGEVDVTDSSCDVVGLDRIAQNAIDRVTEGMAKQLGTSNKIRDAADAGKTGTVRRTAVAAAPPPSPIAASSPAASNLPPSQPSPSAAASAPEASGEPASLLFRAIMRDENRNQLLHAGESISVEIEVKNEGPGEASGVEIVVSGTPELVEQIPNVLPVGDIPSDGVKRVSLDGKIGMVKEAVQAELMLVLRSRSPADRLPSAKKFHVAMKPSTAPGATAMPLDVDELPKRTVKFKQPKAIGVAIGIGQFRENGLQRVKYAAHDAETVATYWQAILGIPSDRVRRLTDSHALKSDLAEIFEEWLPGQVDSTSVAYIYVSGRGAVEAATGAVSLIPFDGSVSSGSRVYSLRRLHEALVKLPIQRAIVILDLSLEQSKKSESLDGAAPVWEQGAQGKEKVMWMVGNRAVQDAHPYDVGQHGLFTYEVLKGLAGAADVDRDGTILAGELCTYAKGQVIQIAREQFGNEQEPLCIPGPGQGAAVRLQPLAKLK